MTKNSGDSASKITAIVIPAHNEAERIGLVIKSAQRYVTNIIVIDDGSHDNTAQQAREAGAIVLQHKVNLGKGAALKTGCDYALQQGFQQLVVMDADGQHNPDKIPEFLAALQQHDIVLGARTVPDSMPLVMLVGNKVINQALSMLYKINITDSQCGYRSFTAAAYQKICWEAQNYYVETEMVIKAGKKRLNYIQIPIETIYSDKYKGTTVLDGLMIVAKMISWRLFK